MSVDLVEARIALVGELDRTSCQRAEAAWRVLGVASPRRWVMDVQALTFCDVAGLRTLHTAQQAAASSGAQLFITGARPSLRWLLTLVGLDDALAPAGHLPQAPSGTDRSYSVPSLVR